ncbi:MAG: glycosyltransferase [Pseudomonadota bacterium]
MKVWNTRSEATETIAKADTARDTRNWTLAAQLYAAALELDGSRADIWVQLGHAHKESGDLKAATDAYAQAIEIEPESSDAHLQLGHALKLRGDGDGARKSYESALGLDSQNFHAAQELGRTVANVRTAKAIAQADFVFDVSDLMQYFRDSRLPTGIQRVQIEVISNLLAAGPYRDRIEVVSFDEAQTGWKPISSAAFLQLAQLAVISGDNQSPDWKITRDRVFAELSTAPLYHFKQGARLINIGTSWWLPNYFLHIREAKRNYSIQYIPFVHDCIPAITPEYCSEGLIQEFNGWLVNVLGHADGFLANSQSSANDLSAMAKTIGRSIQLPTVVTLDANYSGLKGDEDPALSSSLASQGRGLTRRPFVLFVATVEARKNHGLVLEAWQQLIRRLGETNVPNLICVGKRGWMVDGVIQKYETSPELKRKISFAHGLSDEELGALYKKCLFFIYPSNYEGWGLPVTEGLCAGKTGIVANTSSMPEAGGKFVEYVDPGNRSQLVEKLTDFITQPANVKKYERLIQREFAAREWSDIATDIVAGAEQFRPKSRSVDAQLDKTIEPGLFYRLKRNSSSRVAPGLINNEVFRDGHGWYGPDDFGCWTRSSLVELSFMAPRSGTGQLYLEVSGFPGGGESYTVTGMCQSEQDRIVVGPNARVWLSWPVTLAKGKKVDIELDFDSEFPLSNVAPTDHRIVTGAVCGFTLQMDDDIPARMRFQESMLLGRRELCENNRLGGV